MKHKHAIRRAAALALTALLGLGALWPALSTRAGAEFDIDTSSHQAPAIEDFDAYNWKPGLPPYTRENHMQNNELRRFPVLLTWMDHFGTNHYFRVDRAVATHMYENLSAVISKFHYTWYGALDYIDLDFNGHLFDPISYDDDHSGRRNGLFDDDGGYPDGLYMKNLCYPAGDSDDLWNEAKLKLDMVDKYGKLLTLSCPTGVPNITPMVQDASITTLGAGTMFMFSPLGPYRDCPGYVLSVNLTDSWFYESDYAGNHYYTDGGLRKGLNLIVPFRADRLRSKYYPLWRWSLMGMNDNTWRQANNWFFDLQGRSASYYDYADGSAQRASGWGATDSDRDNYVIRAAVATRYYGWFAKEEISADGKKQYVFFGPGSKAFIRENGKTQTDGDRERNMHNRSPLIQLGHNETNLATFGEVRNDGYSWQQDIWNGGSIWYNIVQKYNTRFTCYYAERVPVRVLKTDTRVVDGQVSELAGPVLITNNPTITVEDGGTLVVSNWVMNNGKIIVEEGGTLYLSDNASLNRYEDGGNTGGGIICSGLIIVGENAKLIGGGVDGIQLKNGAHVVNYGCLASENFSCVEDHTIENRGQGFVRYGAGNAVEGSGSLTFETPLDYSGRSFAGRITGYSNPSVSVNDDAIYNGD